MEEAGVPIAPANTAQSDAPTAASPVPAATSESGDSISGVTFLVDCGCLLIHVACALLQGILGIIPLMLLWSVLCTFAALVFLPMDLVLAVAHVIKQARQQG
jgi:hypothetical protein